MALRQVEVPYYRGTGQQRGRVFDTIAQNFDRAAIPFLPNYVFLIAKHEAKFFEFCSAEDCSSY